MPDCHTWRMILLFGKSCMVGFSCTCFLTLDFLKCIHIKAPGWIVCIFVLQLSQRFQAWRLCVLVLLWKSILLFWETFLQASQQHISRCVTDLLKVDCQSVIGLLDTLFFLHKMSLVLSVFPSHWPLCFSVVFSFCSFCVIVVSFTVSCFVKLLFQCLLFFHTGFLSIFYLTVVLVLLSLGWQLQTKIWYLSVHFRLH